MEEKGARLMGNGPRHEGLAGAWGPVQQDPTGRPHTNLLYRKEPAFIGTVSRDFFLLFFAFNILSGPHMIETGLTGSQTFLFVFMHSQMGGETLLKTKMSHLAKFAVTCWTQIPKFLIEIMLFSCILNAGPKKVLTKMGKNYIYE